MKDGQPTARVRIKEFELEKWFLKEELYRPKNDGFVFFIHTKFLLIDPLSDDPLVCSGSANFSTGSLLQNDENMLLIRGDTRVADIYMTEFDRIMRHLWRDLFYSLRSLARTPALSATIVLTVGVGLGATTGMLAVVRAVLLNPLPYASPGTLVWIDTDHAPNRFPLSVVDYRALE